MLIILSLGPRSFRCKMGETKSLVHFSKELISIVGLHQSANYRFIIQICALSTQPGSFPEFSKNSELFLGSLHKNLVTLPYNLTDWTSNLLIVWVRFTIGKLEENRMKANLLGTQRISPVSLPSHQNPHPGVNLNPSIIIRSKMIM